MAVPAATPLARLLRRLDLEPQGADAFVGHPGKGVGSLFGGLLVAQAVIAAERTVTTAVLHSVHVYFLRPGKHGVPIRFVVDRLRDGRTFATRQVIARQAGAAIGTLSASFTRPEAGISHQEPMPDAPAPEGLPDWEDLRATLLGDPALRRPDGPVEVRVCDPDSPDAGARLPARRRVWLRPRGTLPDDPRVHAAVLLFATDRTLLRTATRPHGVPWARTAAASLDHAVWLHRPARFDGWVLYACDSPAAHAARGLVLGAMYRRDGTRVATVAQEGLFRVARGREPG